MIIVKLQGGLGNQMFQYALGRKLAILNEAELKLDLNFLNDKTPRAHFTIRNYELEAFNIKGSKVDKNKIEPFYGHGLISLFRRKLSSVRPVYDKMLRHNKKVFDIKGDLFLDGYWQSEKYFLDIRTTLLKDFTLKQDILEKIKYDTEFNTLKQQILLSQSISIHFRRGDYITDSVTSQFHGTASLEYYSKAIAKINEMIPNSHFFLFTDDPEWVIKQNIVKEIPCTLATTSNIHLDMYLMSQCKHNIIANSSFSWWGAWLNQNEDKLVIAPKKWYAQDKLNQNTIDLIPE